MAKVTRQPPKTKVYNFVFGNERITKRLTKDQLDEYLDEFKEIAKAHALAVTGLDLEVEIYPSMYYSDTFYGTIEEEYEAISS